jgi:hypothetical protein
MQLNFRYLPVRGEAGAIRIALDLVEGAGFSTTREESVAFGQLVLHDSSPLNLPVPTLLVTESQNMTATIQHEQPILSFLAELAGLLPGRSLDRARASMISAEAGAITQLHLSSDLAQLKLEGLVAGLETTSVGSAAGTSLSALQVAEGLFFRTTLLGRLSKLNTLLTSQSLVASHGGTGGSAAGSSPSSGTSSSSGPTTTIGSTSSTSMRLSFLGGGQLTIADISVVGMLERLNKDLHGCIYTPVGATGLETELTPACQEVAGLVELLVEVNRQRQEAKMRAAAAKKKKETVAGSLETATVTTTAAASAMAATESTEAPSAPSGPTLPGAAAMTMDVVG